jgi:hypothetical protein
MFIIKGFVSDGYELFGSRTKTALTESEARQIEEEMDRSGLYDLVSVEEVTMVENPNILV